MLFNTSAYPTLPSPLGHADPEVRLARYRSPGVQRALEVEAADLAAQRCKPCRPRSSRV